MMNVCQFSDCRRYRYSLTHEIEPLLPYRPIMWIGLNPSTADEQKLDPTLRRIRAFSQAWGFTAFIMTNLFAFRATDPRDMKAAADPVGPLNDRVLDQIAAQCDTVIACWGTHGDHLDRAQAVKKLLSMCCYPDMSCLGTNVDHSPKHPLYVAGKTQPIPL